MSALKLLLNLVILSTVQFAIAQNVLTASPAVEQRIKRVENGLIAGIVIKGNTRAVHNLAARMKDLHVPGVSIAVTHDGKIERARGFGVAAMRTSSQRRNHVSGRFHQ